MYIALCCFCSFLLLYQKYNFLTITISSSILLQYILNGEFISRFIILEVETKKYITVTRYTSLEY